MKTLILLRGLPGAGKTTLAKKLTPYNYCADYYIEQQAYEHNTTYFKIWKETVDKAHTICRNTIKEWMIQEQELIVVHNVFSTKRSMQFYLDLAKYYNYMVNVLTVERIHSGKSVHSVPRYTIEKMIDQWQILDPELKTKYETSS